MHYFFSTVIRSVLTLAVILGAILYAFFWIDNAALGLSHWIGLPLGLWIVIIIMAWVLSFNFATFLFSVVGFLSAWFLVGWPWYGIMAFYFPTLMVFLGLSFLEGLIDLFHFVRPRKYSRPPKSDKKGY